MWSAPSFWRSVRSPTTVLALSRLADLKLRARSAIV
jgi:hypothetical protein